MQEKEYPLPELDTMPMAVESVSDIIMIQTESSIYARQPLERTLCRKAGNLSGSWTCLQMVHCSSESYVVSYSS